MNIFEVNSEIPLAIKDKVWDNILTNLNKGEPKMVDIYTAQEIWSHIEYGKSKLIPEQFVSVNDYNILKFKVECLKNNGQDNVRPFTMQEYHNLLTINNTLRQFIGAEYIRITNWLEETGQLL